MAKYRVVALGGKGEEEEIAINLIRDLVPYVTRIKLEIDIPHGHHCEEWVREEK